MTDIKRFKIISATIVSVIILGFVGTCIYFVAGVSAVLPPIKIYDYSGNMVQFLKKIKSVSDSNPNICIMNGETVGNKANGYAYEITIRLKNIDRNIEFNIKYEESDSRSASHKGIINLIGAFDLTHNLGGYGIDGKGVKDLVNLFEIYILPKLRN
jgi:hypothetical protein